MVDVRLDRRERDEELRGNLLVRVADADELEDLPLALGKVCGRWRGRWLRVLRRLSDLGRLMGREQPLHQVAQELPRQRIAGQLGPREELLERADTARRQPEVIEAARARCSGANMGEEGVVIGAPQCHQQVRLARERDAACAPQGLGARGELPRVDRVSRQKPGADDQQIATVAMERGVPFLPLDLVGEAAQPGGVRAPGPQGDPREERLIAPLEAVEALRKLGLDPSDLLGELGLLVLDEGERGAKDAVREGLRGSVGGARRVAGRQRAARRRGVERLERAPRLDARHRVDRCRILDPPGLDRVADFLQHLADCFVVVTLGGQPGEPMFICIIIN